MAIPVNGSTHLIPALLLIYRPRKDERLSWPSWLTCSGWFTHISGHPSAAGRMQDRESSPARDRRSTTVLRHRPVCVGLLVDRRGVQQAAVMRRGAGLTTSVIMTLLIRWRLLMVAAVMTSDAANEGDLQFSIPRINARPGKCK